MDGGLTAIAAGCDVLLYPADLAGVIRGVERAVDEGRLPRERVEEALARIERAAASVAGGPTGPVGADADRRWSLETAVRSMRVARGEPRLPAGPLRLIEVEDDLGGPWPPYPRDAFPTALRDAGVPLADDGTPLIVVYSDIRAWKGRPGVSAAARERVRQELDSHPNATVILFSLPRMAAELPTARNLLAAWGGEGIMQQAAVAWLTGVSGGLAGLYAGLDR